MLCPQCHGSNREAAGFCATCGTALTRHCTQCGGALSAGARFCGACGVAVRHRGMAPRGDGGFVLPSTILRERYRIDEVLGHGGMGAVYRATDLTFQAQVAVKENLGPSAEAQRQFATEAAILHGVRHPNLPRVTDYFVLAGQGQYLVMDFVPGEDLGHIIARRGRLPEDEAVLYIAPVLDALEYLHSRSIFHRDVKPTNIKVTPQGEVFLVDFGLAKAGSALQETAKGAQGATAGFAPLEQYGMGRSDARTDLYAVGATLYSALCGQAPPPAHDLAAGVAALPPLRQANPDLSEEVTKVVLRSLQTRPIDRFQTAGEMRAALLRQTALPGQPAAPARWAVSVLGPTPLLEETRPRRVGSGAALFAPRLRIDLPAEPAADAQAGTGPAFLELCPVPAGEFLMGSAVTDRLALEHEKPEHWVYLDAYYIGRFPVTNAQYAHFLRATGHAPPPGWGRARGTHPAGKEEHPVAHVSVEDALAFCQWAGLRLPTEAEWEKAARGPAGHLYPWGDGWSEGLCNSAEEPHRDTVAVGTYSPGGDSPYGCADMAGNVWEWVGDWYDAAYYGWCPPRNPPGPSSGPCRVLRGGSYLSASDGVRSTFRNWPNPVLRELPVGFRCARQAEPWDG